MAVSSQKEPKLWSHVTTKGLPTSGCGARCLANRTKPAPAKSPLSESSISELVMNRDWYKWAVLLMWVTLPTSAWNYWRVWDQLPERMAVHFGANWPPNGFTSREGAFQLGLGILV